MKIQITKMYSIFLLLFSLFIFNKNSYAQHDSIIIMKMEIAPMDLETLKNGTVKIESNDDEGNTIESGTGIIVGYQNEKLYLVSAKHVVNEADELNLTFYSQPLNKYPASVYQPHPIYDLVILVAEIPSSNGLNFPTLNTRIIDEKKDNLGTDVLIIGHPNFSTGNGWQMLNQNQIQSFNFPPKEKNTDIFSITAGNIKAGCSGGPVFDENFNLIGMVITVGDYQSECIKIEKIENMITGFDVPKNKLQPALIFTPPSGGGNGGTGGITGTRPTKDPVLSQTKPTRPRPTTPPIDQSNIAGSWFNEKKTNGMTRAIIRKKGSGYQIQGFGKCVPKDCDWGVTSLRSSRLHRNIAVYKHSFKTTTLQVNLLSNDRLSIKSTSKYKDKKRKDVVKTYYFKKRKRPTRPRPAKVLLAPKQVSPANGKVFTHFPRKTKVSWKATSGAKSYTVELDCMSCCSRGKWCKDVGKKYRVVPKIKGTSYSFSWVGAQKGRWRVWAIDAKGKAGKKSAWRTFNYTR